MPDRLLGLLCVEPGDQKALCTGSGRLMAAEIICLRFVSTNLCLWLDAALNFKVRESKESVTVRYAFPFSCSLTTNLMRSLGIFFHYAFIPEASTIRLPISSCPLTAPVPHARTPTHTYQTEIILSSGHAADCF